MSIYSTRYSVGSTYITPPGRVSRATGFLKSGKARIMKSVWGSSMTCDEQKKLYDAAPKLGDA